MATFRVGVGSFTIAENKGVGFGTSPTDGLGNLQVKGVTKTTGSIVSGASSLTRYSGFAADNINQLENITLTSEVGTIGDIVVGVGTSVIISSASTVTVGTLESVSIGTHFSPPTGGIEERGQDFVEGMMRFNTDLNTMEFYNGNGWRQFTYIQDIKSSPSTRGRGVMGGGNPVPGDHNNTIEFVEVATLGNSLSFGDLTVSRDCPGMGCCSDGKRGLFMGGWVTPTDTDVIDYITIASEGDAIDFGNASVARGFSATCSSSTRGFNMGGYNPSTVNIIDYVEIQTLGNALDFGDLAVVRESFSGLASPTRAITSGGMTPSIQSRIDFFTMSSKGNSVRFGNLTSEVRGNGSLASQVRGIMGGGTRVPSSGTEINIINYITIASEGDASDFGDLTRKARKPAGLSNATRGIFANGYIAPSLHNTMDFITISTTGNAQDFGDATEACNGRGTCSDTHGGLGGY